MNAYEKRQNRIERVTKKAFMAYAENKFIRFAVLSKVRKFLDWEFANWRKNTKVKDI